MDLIHNEYRFNSNFRKYVNEYCKKNDCSIEDALKDKNIKRMFWRYTDV